MGIRIAPPPKVTMSSTFASVAILAGAQALGILTAPGAQRGSFDETFLNQASESAIYSFLAGTNRIVPPLTWYGDFATKKVKNDVAVTEILLQAGLGGLAGYTAGGGSFGFAPDPPTAIFGLAEGTMAGAIVAELGALRTFSFRYYAGFAYTIGHGRINRVTEVYVDERRVNAAPGEAGSTMLLDDPQAWGGDHVQGGVYAVCDIVPGDKWPTQQPNPYLKQMLGSVPAFSGKALFIMRGPQGFPESGYFAAGVKGSPQLRPVSLVIERFPDNLGVPEFSVIRSKDANPMEVIFDWMTGRTRGYGYGGKVPIEKFDFDEFRAAAETVYDEGLGYSAELKDNVSVAQNLEDLCQFVGCVLYEHPQTGLITPKLIRRDYDVDELPVFDETNVIDVDGYTPGTYRDTPNEIRLTYLDRDNNYKPRPIIAQNDASLRLLGEVIPRSINFPGIGCKETANIISARELAASFPKEPFKLVVNSDGEPVQFGDPIVWRSEKHRIAQMVLRVIGAKKSDTASNTVVLTVSMDVFGRGDVVTATPAETTWTLPHFDYSSGEIILPQLQIFGEGIANGTAGYGDFDLPMLQVSGSGEVLVGAEGDFNLPLLQINGAGEVAFLAVGGFDLPQLQISGTGTVVSNLDLLTEDGDTLITEDGDNLQQEN